MSPSLGQHQGIEKAEKDVEPVCVLIVKLICFTGVLINFMPDSSRRFKAGGNEYKWKITSDDSDLVVRVRTVLTNKVNLKLAHVVR